MRAVPGTVYAVHARKAVTRGDHSRRFGSVLAFVLSFVLSPSSSKTFSTLTAFSNLFSNLFSDGPERLDYNFVDLFPSLNMGHIAQFFFMLFTLS